ncbi:MAG: hypothetical protein HGB19_04105 [Chlorobiales bacterium]|nr:hypothetical protein [Chlorobiales bacterium]
MTPYIDTHIQKDTPINRQFLLDMDKKLGPDVSIVYIYALADERVNYPDKPGHVIYIGEACRSSGATGKRFAQHISTSETQGGDTGTIYSLSRYYWRGKKIRLQVFIVDNPCNREPLERELLCAHVKKFGALPICQGTTGKNYGTTALSNLKIPQERIALFFPTAIQLSFRLVLLKILPDFFSGFCTNSFAKFLR